ncbi:MAG: DUF484 family protein [Panacagrimonas sp.]
MSGRSRPPASIDPGTLPSVSALNDQDVAAYLRSHPDFLIRHPELLESMELTHASGSAVSMIERQVELLRGRNRRLDDRLAELLEVTRDNEQRAANVHRLARALVRAPTLASAIVALRACMRDDFKVDETFVGVSSTILKRADIDGLTRLEPDGAVTRAFDNFFRTKLIECGPLSAQHARLLFPKAAELPLSAAVVPLEKDKTLGMLVLASRDPERFQPHLGRMFLEMTAELVAASIRAKST